MTRVVQDLERDGLVKREAVADDARSVLIRATPRGARLLNEGRARRVKRLASDLAALEHAELDLLARAAVLLERVTRAEPRKP
jgi:DNA-binding MarR family transcriptional regulator